MGELLSEERNRRPLCNGDRERRGGGGGAHTSPVLMASFRRSMRAGLPPARRASIAQRGKKLGAEGGGEAHDAPGRRRTRINCGDGRGAALASRVDVALPASRAKLPKQQAIPVAVAEGLLQVGGGGEEKRGEREDPISKNVAHVARRT